MAKLEDLTRGAAVKGILPDCLVTVIDVKWYGSAAVELTYKDPAGKPNVVLLYRDREPTLEIAETGRPWSFDGDGKLFRLVSEAHRITGALIVTVTRNEILTALNKPDDFILDVGQMENGQQKLISIRRPFQQEPDFAVESINYNFQNVLSRGQSPA